jgi:PleD family two-component response regulator
LQSSDLSDKVESEPVVNTVRTYFDVHGHYEVLSVDDDQVNQMVVEGLLRPAGYKVRME